MKKMSTPGGKKTSNTKPPAEDKASTGSGGKDENFSTEKRDSIKGGDEIRFFFTL